MKPILEVAYLTNDHGNTLQKCPGCKICDRIVELRELLNPDPLIKYRYLLEKGRDIKPSEVQYLMDKGIDRKTIVKHMKMGVHQFNEVMENHGLFEVRKRRAVEEMGNFTMTFEEYKNLKAQGKTNKEIADIGGIKEGNLNYHIKKWKEQMEQPKQAANEEYNNLIEQLKEQVKQKDGTIEKLEKKIEQLEQDKKDIHAAASDTESELMIDADIWKQQALQYKAENGRLSNDLLEVRQDLSKYKGEYELVRATLKAVL